MSSPIEGLFGLLAEIMKSAPKGAIVFASIALGVGGGGVALSVKRSQAYAWEGYCDLQFEPVGRQTRGLQR